jgi:hypothetical protein
VGKLGVAVGKRFENMEKDEIAVGKRVGVVWKSGFAEEARVSAVAGDLKTVDFSGIAVGKRGLAVEKGGSAVGEDGSAVEENDAASGHKKSGENQSGGDSVSAGIF